MILTISTVTVIPGPLSYKLEHLCYSHVSQHPENMETQNELPIF